MADEARARDALAQFFDGGFARGCAMDISAIDQKREAMIARLFCPAGSM